MKIALAMTLLAGSAQAAEPLQPLPGESPAAFQCRVVHVPEVRQCVAACQAKPAGDARWECTHACTTKGLWAMAQCRGQGPAAASTASR